MLASRSRKSAQAPDFDDHDWEMITLQHTWSSKDGEAWFRATVDVPGEVQGIRLAGNKLELELFLAIGATIYVNGREMFSEPSWADARAVRLPLAEHYQPGSPLSLAVCCPAGDGFGLFLSSILHFSSLDQAIFELDLVRAPDGLHTVPGRSGRRGPCGSLGTGSRSPGPGSIGRE